MKGIINRIKLNLLFHSFTFSTLLLVTMIFQYVHSHPTLFKMVLVDSKLFSHYGAWFAMKKLLIDNAFVSENYSVNHFAAFTYSASLWLIFKQG